MTRLLSSARFQRRLFRYGGGAVVVGAAIFLGIHWSSSPKFAKPRGGPVQTVPPTPRSVRRNAQELGEIRGVAEHFINTAVYRRHLDEAYALTAPSLREGMSLHDWRSGNIPVVPYPQSDVAEVRWRLAYSLPRLVGMKIALIPKATAKHGGLVASLELQRVGQGANRRWLVDAWVPLGGGEELNRAASALGTQQTPQTQPRLSSAWLLLPFVLVGGIMLALPITLGVRGWRRNQRAERAYRSSSNPS